MVTNRGLAAYMERVFEADWSMRYGDTLRLQAGTPFGPPPDDFVPERGILTGSYPHPFTVLPVQGPVLVSPVLAPDHGLLQKHGVIGLMRSARRRLLIQQQYIHTHWGPATGSAIETPDLFLEEAIAAARRGVAVRILLSNAFLDPENPKDNTVTVSYVNGVAVREGLDLQARILASEIGLDKIHNKGVIADDRRAFVGSINWSYNSPTNNREVGIIVDHPAIGEYFADVFRYDWHGGAAQWRTMPF